MLTTHVIGDSMSPPGSRSCCPSALAGGEVGGKGGSCPLRRGGGGTLQPGEEDGMGEGLLY